jgi:hypothetical protein
MLSVALRNFAVRLAVTTVLSFCQHPTYFCSLHPHMTGTIKVE